MIQKNKKIDSQYDSHFDNMRISQYFEWNQNFLNFYYFIDFKFQMGNIMI